MRPHKLNFDGKSKLIMNHFLKKSTETIPALNKKLNLNYLDTIFGGLACDTVKLSVSADRI